MNYFPKVKSTQLVFTISNMKTTDIITLIANTGSTNEKKAILEKNKNNDLLKNCFLYTENKRFNYYIKVEQTTGSGKVELADEHFILLDALNARVVTGNEARDLVNKAMEKMTIESQELFCKIINRDLRCGAGTTIANKVWKNLIPEYPVMLASKFDAKAQKYLSQYENNVGFYVQCKMDGGRCLVKVSETGDVTYHSRSGSILDLFHEFDDQFSPFRGMIFDGELLVLTKTGKRDRVCGNGLYTKAVRNTLSAEEAKRFTIVLWDVIPEKEYLIGKGTESYSTRLDLLQTMEPHFGATGVRVVESKKVNTLGECLEFYGNMRSRGEEGAIIKVANSVWEDTRSKNMVKMKAVETGDFVCVGVEPGAGKYANMIGALVCETSCGKVNFSVGTGLTDKDRALSNKYIDKIIEVKYNEVISSKNKDTKSLFLPVFVQVRDDKTIANSLEELK